MALFETQSFVSIYLLVFDTGDNLHSFNDNLKHTESSGEKHGNGHIELKYLTAVLLTFHIITWLYYNTYVWNLNHRINFEKVHQYIEDVEKYIKSSMQETFETQSPTKLPQNLGRTTIIESKNGLGTSAN